MELGELMEGEINLREWEEQIMAYAPETQRRGMQMGERSQFERHPLAGDLERVAISDMMTVIWIGFIEIYLVRRRVYFKES